MWDTYPHNPQQPPRTTFQLAGLFSYNNTPHTNPQINTSAWVFCTSWCADLEFRGRPKRTASIFSVFFWSAWAHGQAVRQIPAQQCADLEFRGGACRLPASCGAGVADVAEHAVAAVDRRVRRCGRPPPAPQINISTYQLCMSWYADLEFRVARHLFVGMRSGQDGADRIRTLSRMSHGGSADAPVSAGSPKT